MSAHDEEKKSVEEEFAATDEAEAVRQGGGEVEEPGAAPLEGELAAKAEEARRNWDLYVRERAELENFRKRMQREKAEALRFANESLIRDLLPVIDNLERAVEHAATSGNGEPLLEGVKMVLKDAHEALERHGVKRMDAVGETFDPARHEAVARVSDPEREPNQVVEQFLPGYTLHDRLLRAAQVGVSSGEAVETPGSDD